MIKAIIFDCFGVLTNDGWLAFKDQYLVEPSARGEAIELNRQADAGFISQDQFESELARLSGADKTTVRRVIDSHQPNETLLDYIRDSLKSHYKIGLLSNVSADFTPELFSPEQNALFDAKTFSYELGVIKPHPAMYESIAAKLNALPEECIFVDDREMFVTGGREIGMQGIQFITNEATIAELERALEARNI